LIVYRLKEYYGNSNTYSIPTEFEELNFLTKY